MNQKLILTTLLTCGCELESENVEWRLDLSDRTCDADIAGAELFQDAPDSIKVNEPELLCDVLEFHDHYCWVEKGTETCCERPATSGPQTCCTLNSKGTVNCYTAPIPK